LPAVILNLGAILLFGTYYALRAVSPALVASITPEQVQFLAYLLVFVVELTFVFLLIRKLAANGLALQRVIARDGCTRSFRWAPAIGVFLLFNAAFLLYVGLASRLYGGWPSLRNLLVWQRLFLLLAVPLQAAFCEEIIWRGYLIDRLHAQGRTQAAAIVLSAISFSLIHGIFLVDKLVFTFVLGLLAGVYFVRERNLAPLMVSHFVADLWSFGLSVV